MRSGIILFVLILNACGSAQDNGISRGYRVNLREADQINIYIPGYHYAVLDGEYLRDCPIGTSSVYEVRFMEAEVRYLIASSKIATPDDVSVSVSDDNVVNVALWDPFAKSINPEILETHLQGHYWCPFRLTTLTSAPASALSENIGRLKTHYLSQSGTPIAAKIFYDSTAIIENHMRMRFQITRMDENSISGVTRWEVVEETESGYVILRMVEMSISIQSGDLRVEVKVHMRRRRISSDRTEELVGYGYFEVEDRLLGRLKSLLLKADESAR